MSDAAETPVPDDEPDREDPPGAAGPDDAGDDDATEPKPDDDVGEDERSVVLPLRINPALNIASFLGPGSAVMSGFDLTGLRKTLAAFDVSHLMPELPSMIFPALDVGRLFPDISAMTRMGLDRAAFDFTPMLPKLDFGPLLTNLPDFSSLMPKLDFGPDLTALLEGLRRRQPPNWSDDIDLEAVIEVIQTDGLPLVWVPRADLVDQLLLLPDRDLRLAVLVCALPEIADDCDAVLNDVQHEIFAGQSPLARRAVAALRAGHHEAAQALAVVVTETAVAHTLGGDYKKVKKQVLFDPELVPYTQLRLRAALAPIGPFYTAWYANSGEPRPEGLSRHVSVHQADEQHYTLANAVVAVMLATSVLRALQELQELAEAAQSDEEDKEDGDGS